MTSAHVFVPLCFSVLLFISGCSSVGGDVFSRSQCTANRSPQRCSRLLDEGSRRRSQLQASLPGSRGVLAYLGRAYLETGRDTLARQTLERAVNLDKDDSLAHLYLGIVLLKTGERERGRKEIEEGLRAIDDTIEFFAEEDSFRLFWDPNMQIRNDIRKSLAAKLDDAQLAMAAERIGSQFDEEIDEARRDESRRRGGGGDGGGGGN